MTLTTEQLILIKDAVGTVGCVISAGDVRFANTTLAFIDAELLRRKVGPFTLAEAVASGRPFRRKAWGDDPSFCRLAKDCSSSWFDFGWQTDCISDDDIIACDYELAKGGE